MCPACTGRIAEQALATPTRKAGTVSLIKSPSSHGFRLHRYGMTSAEPPASFKSTRLPFLRFRPQFRNETAIAAATARPCPPRSFAKHLQDVLRKKNICKMFCERSSDTEDAEGVAEEGRARARVSFHKRYADPGVSAAAGCADGLDVPRKVQGGEGE